MTRATPTLAAVCSLICLALTACPPRASTGGEATSYDSAVARWTAQAELYQLEDIRAKFAATLQSDIFLRALVGEEARRWELGPTQSEALMQKERDEHKDHTVFIVGMYIDPPRDNKLGPRSNWRITLMTQTEEIVPETVEELGIPTENQRALYPYLDVFWRQYRVSFKLVTSPGPWTLRVASDIGTAKLRFLQPLGGPGQGEPSSIPVSRLAPEGNL